VLIELYARQQGHKLKSWGEYERRMKGVFGKHMTQPLSELTLQGLQATADRWPAAQSAASAVRYLRPMLKWASHPARTLVPRELVLLTAPATVARRQRVLSRPELAALLPVLRASTSPYAAGAQFMLLTACRRDEACSAVWRDVDLASKVWRLPETKSGHEHTIPLSRQAIELLQAQPQGDNAGALVFTGAGGKLTNWHRETVEFMQASGTEGWHRHDLRRTSATMLGEMLVEPHVVEAALGHVAIHSSLASVYNTARYLPAVRDALQRLADALDLIAGGGAAVVIARPIGL
jgi:integrase